MEKQKITTSMWRYYFYYKHIVKSMPLDDNGQKLYKMMDKENKLKFINYNTNKNGKK